MAAEIWVAVITGIASVCGVVITVIFGNRKNAKVQEENTRLTLYRIGQLEEKVNKHNNLIERTYQIEKRLDVDEEKIKVANHRLDDLEGELK